MRTYCTFLCLKGRFQTVGWKTNAVITLLILSRRLNEVIPEENSSDTGKVEGNFWFCKYQIHFHIRNTAKNIWHCKWFSHSFSISLFPNNVIRVTGNAGTFAFETKGLVCIPEYDRSNDIPFEEQKRRGWFYNFILFFDYILLTMLLKLSWYFPLCPPLPSNPPATPTPLFMSMGHVYKFFGYSISYTYCISPWLFCNYIFVFLYHFTSSPIPPHPLPTSLATIKMLSVSMILSLFLNKSL